MEKYMMNLDKHSFYMDTYLTHVYEFNTNIGEQESINIIMNGYVL